MSRPIKYTVPWLPMIERLAAGELSGYALSLGLAVWELSLVFGPQPPDIFEAAVWGSLAATAVDSRATDLITTTGLGVAAALGLIYNDGQRVCPRPRKG